MNTKFDDRHRKQDAPGGQGSCRAEQSHGACDGVGSSENKHYHTKPSLHQRLRSSIQSNCSTIRKGKSRKHPVHGVHIKVNIPTIIFLTVCTKDRSPWLASESVHNLLQKTWKDATAWYVGRYVIMPDHIHAFVAPGDIDIALDRWVQYWKSQFSKQHSLKEHRWQSEFWDTQLRSFERYDDKWQYVQLNPVRHGFVDRVDAWPYQGEIYNLYW